MKPGYPLGRKGPYLSNFGHLCTPVPSAAMGETTGTTIRIQKLKGTQNWTSWYSDIESILVKAKTWKYACGPWKYACGRVKKPTQPVKPTGTLDAKAHEAYDEKLEKYEEDLEKYVEGHEEAMAEIRLTSEEGPRVHLVNVKNAHDALEIYKKLYGGGDLAAIEVSWREITRANFEDHPSVEAYGQHLKSHREKIIQAGKDIQD